MKSKMPFWACAVFVIFSFYGTSAKLSDYYSILPENFLAQNAYASNIGINDSYCFHFTWMGHSFDNRTYGRIENKTCSEFNADLKIKPLCVDPMVATFKGKEPDIDYILANYPEFATCRLSEDQVCAKYSIYYNGILTNVTRYCTRIAVAFEGSMESGCISDSSGSYTVEVCACKSNPGEFGCNSSHSIHISLFLITSIFILNALLKYIN